MKKLLGLLVMSGAVLGALFVLTSVSGPGAGQAAPTFTLKQGTTIQDGSIVSLEYTLTDESGNLIESNAGKEPLTYIHGAGQIVKGLEKEMLGLKIGDQKKVRVTPEEGYGVMDPNALQELPKDKVPAEALKVGAQLMTQGPGGQMIPMRVHEIKDNAVVVDLNHPLAGKVLNFDVKVKDIKTAEPK